MLLRSGAVLALATVFLTACGGHRPPADARPSASSPALSPVAPAAPPVSEGARRHGARVVAHAEAFAHAGHLPPASRRDCSGFILAAFRAAGDPLQVPREFWKEGNTSAMLHAWSEASHRAFARGTPLPGDLIFFRDTVRTRGGRGHVTHIAMVERVADDGTVLFLHYMGGRVRHDRMNLLRPDDPSRNAWLKRKRRRGEPTLAGELFVAYARFP